jgi:hypothetical protein
MAIGDVKHSLTPHNDNRTQNDHPSVGGLRTAISGSGVSASYPTAFLNTATKQDLIYVCILHGISVTGL